MQKKEANIFNILENDLFYKLENGIFKREKKYLVSYPENGNDSCFQLEDSSFWFKHRNKIIVDQLNTENPTGLVLDVGGGNGFVTLALQKIGLKSVLVEPNLTGCINAQNRGVKNIINGDLKDLENKNIKVDIICAFDVIEHIPDDQDFLNSCFELLENKGKVILAVPSFNFLWADEDNHAGHFRRYTKKGITETLNSNGFQIEYVSYFFSFLLIPILLIRTIPYKLKIRVTDKLKNGHMKSNWLIDFFCKIEQILFSRRKFIPFGSSLFIIASKKN
jgi:SAM-dependent methyltransferase